MGRRRKKNGRRAPIRERYRAPETLSLAELGVELEIARFTEEAAERETLVCAKLVELRRALNERHFGQALQLLLAAWRIDQPEQGAFIDPLQALASREPQAAHEPDLEFPPED